MADEQVIVLSDKQQARTRINVFHGSANNYINVIKELIGNALDVFPKNELNTIKITLHDSNKIEYEDSGKGIPVEGVASNGMANYEAIFEKPFAGTKYNNAQDTVGQNGIFLWTLSMTCENIQYEIARPNTNIYTVSYHKGDRVNNLIVNGKSNKTYTKMLFELDKSVWEKPKFTFEQICEIAKGQASLANAKIIIEDKVSNKKEVFYYENGIVDYFGTIAKDKNFVCTPVVLQTSKVFDIIYKEQEVKDPISVNMIFAYSNDNNQDIRKEFLNTADLILYGTIQEGIVMGLKNAIHNWLKDNDKYKKEKNKVESYIKLDDTLIGLNYVCDVRSLYVEYENQTKQRTLDGHYKTALNTIIKDFIEIYFIENKDQAEKMCMQVLINKRVRENSDINRQKTRKELESQSDNVFSRPEKYVASKSNDKTKRKCIFLEGDSALDAVKSARNPEYDAILPLKGKIMNCLKKNIDDILANAEIKSIVKINGAGVTYKGKAVKGLPKFNINNMNFCEFDVMTDADDDGYHIRCLFILMCYMLMPDIITYGRLKILEAPLYRFVTKEIIPNMLCLPTEQKGVFQYVAYSEMERAEILKKLKMPYTETRFKGLGGINTQLMANTVMHEENRRVKIITMEDVPEAIRLLEMFLDDDSTDRREYIEKHGHEYFDYSIYED
jgi:DNA gyrase subunit B